MATKIYTKTGDDGTTSLLGGTKVSKSHVRIEAYGTIDELNSHIGLLRDWLQDEKSRVQLKAIQDELFVIGSLLACDPDKEMKMMLPFIDESHLLKLEAEIDRMTEVLPEMKHFILPGGQQAISQAHICRCVCRRAERLCVHLKDMNEDVDVFLIQYINRLSDYLFVLARYTGHLLGIADIPWMPVKK